MRITRYIVQNRKSKSVRRCISTILLTIFDTKTPRDFNRGAVAIDVGVGSMIPLRKVGAGRAAAL